MGSFRPKNKTNINTNNIDNVERLKLNTLDAFDKFKETAVREVKTKATGLGYKALDGLKNKMISENYEDELTVVAKEEQATGASAKELHNSNSMDDNDKVLHNTAHNVTRRNTMNEIAKQQRKDDNKENEEDDKEERDGYTKALYTILDKLEHCFGLHKTHNNIKYIDMNLVDLAKLLEKLTKEVQQDGKNDAGKYMVELAYLSDRLEFFGYKRVDFSKFTFLETIVPILSMYTTSHRANTIGVPKVKDNTVKILGILRSIELNNKSLKKGLGYRLLRVFSLLVYSNNLIDAGILAKFLLIQMSLGNVKGANKKSTRAQEIQNNSQPVYGAYPRYGHNPNMYGNPNMHNPHNYRY